MNQSLELTFMDIISQAYVEIMNTRVSLTLSGKKRQDPESLAQCAFIYEMPSRRLRRFS